MSLTVVIAGVLALSQAAQGTAVPDVGAVEKMELGDVFELEVAADPRIAPDGESIVYVRRFMDIMQDRSRSNLWLLSTDGSKHRPLTTGDANDASPRWSPDGTRIVYLSNRDGSSQVYLRWMDSGETARLTHEEFSPGALSWSPDGNWLAFSMFVEDPPEEFVHMPAPPEGADWAPAAKVITQMTYRADGQGFLTQGHTQLFVLPTEGGTPRQLTFGNFDVQGNLEWTGDGKALLFSSNRRDDREMEPNDTEIFIVALEDGACQALTGRHGPDHQPKLSPSGTKIAYLGFDDAYQGYQITELYVMDRDGGGSRSLTAQLDRSIEAAWWTHDEKGLLVSYADHGDSLVAYVPLDGGEVTPILHQLGGTTLGRPYSSGSFTVAQDGRIAYTRTSTQRPSDISVFDRQSGVKRQLTHLNDDLLDHKTLGEVEEVRFASDYDELPLQGWIVKPVGFDPTQKYPMILEIHGGPFANYGARFSGECQLYAAAGYVVLYMNPRGSTSYGQAFGNAIHHAYPGHDYDDLMTGVDHLIAKGFVDPEQLYVTGGSGGGVLTAWIVGRTDRFRAAVVAKPVINWTSFALTSDAYNFFYKYWFGDLPWNDHEAYWARSPLSQVGNVKTPTMLLSGEVDYRTPISEAEQFYQALQLCQVETAMVRIPGASHGITARPSNLIAKVAHILAWFERYAPDEE